MLFEVCVDSADGARAAVDSGADRIELCASLDADGLTPSTGLIEWAVRTAAAGTGGPAVHVLIRPRAGDFVYSEAEADIMLRDIAVAKAAGAAGVVIGALTPSGAVDTRLCASLVAAARPASVTFHRAFDAAADPLPAFGEVMALGVDRLLTSGARSTALAGASCITELIRRAQGRVTILAGGGITEVTAPEVVQRTGVRELHFSARSSGPPGIPLRTRIERIMASV